jgi:hypothetical protein
VAAGGVLVGGRCFVSAQTSSEKWATTKRRPAPRSRRAATLFIKLLYIKTQEEHHRIRGFRKNWKAFSFGTAWNSNIPCSTDLSSLAGLSRFGRCLPWAIFGKSLRDWGWTGRDGAGSAGTGVSGESPDPEPPACYLLIRLPGAVPATCYLLISYLVGFREQAPAHCA